MYKLFRCEEYLYDGRIYFSDSNYQPFKRDKIPNNNVDKFDTNTLFEYSRTTCFT